MSGPKFNFRFAINCEENVEADAIFDDEFDDELETDDRAEYSSNPSNVHQE